MERNETKGVIAGIDPTTRECVMVGVDSDDTWAEARAHGYVAVRVSRETARDVFGQKVPDIYAIALATSANLKEPQQ